MLASTVGINAGIEKGVSTLGVDDATLNIAAHMTHKVPMASKPVLD